MTIRNYEIFLTVCQEKTMHAAAKKLHISQPAVSKAIMEMEAYYQVVLFERINHRLYLTEIGMRLAAMAQGLLDLHGQIEDMLYNNQQTSHLRIGASVSVGTCFIPAVLPLIEKDTRVSYDLTINNTSIIEKMIESYELDLGIVEGTIANENLCSSCLFDDELVIVVKNGHPLTMQDGISVNDLERFPMITREDGSSNRNQLETNLQQKGLNLHSNYSCTSIDGIKQGLLATNSFAILSRMVVQNEIKEGTLSLLLPECNCKRSIRLIYHKDRYFTVAMKAFISILNDHIQQCSNNTAA